MYCALYHYYSIGYSLQFNYSSNLCRAVVLGPKRYLALSFDVIKKQLNSGTVIIRDSDVSLTQAHTTTHHTTVVESLRAEGTESIHPFLYRLLSLNNPQEAMATPEDGSIANASDEHPGANGDANSPVSADYKPGELIQLMVGNSAITLRSLENGSLYYILITLGVFLSYGGTFDNVLSMVDHYDAAGMRPSRARDRGVLEYVQLLRFCYWNYYTFFSENYSNSNSCW